MLRTLCLSLVIVFSAAAVPAQEIHSEQCLYGCPFGGSPSDDLIVRDIYVLRSNDLTKFASWVAYRMNRGTIGPTRERVWRADPVLAPEETLEPEDYTDANATLRVDRGHQVPLASFSGTPDWAETNYLSNITPQRSDLNQGAWVRLEEAERNLAQRDGTASVYVMTGPLFERSMAPLPRADEAHVIPSGYWKIVAIPVADAIAASAFLFEQETPRNAGYCDHTVELSEVERRSGFHFFQDYRGQVNSLLTALGC